MFYLRDKLQVTLLFHLQNKECQLFTKYCCSKQYCNDRVDVSINGYLYRGKTLQRIQVRYKSNDRAENDKITNGRPCLPRNSRKRNTYRRCLRYAKQCY